MGLFEDLRQLSEQVKKRQGHINGGGGDEAGSCPAVSPSARLRHLRSDGDTSRVHIRLREEEEQRVLHGAAADDSQKVAGQAERGESRAPQAHAPSHPGTGQLVARRRRWTHPLLRRAHERSGVAPLSIPCRLALAPRAFSAKPERSSPLGPNAAAHRPLAASRPRLPPLPLEATWRHHLRQEPDAGNPPVRIRGGGGQK